MSVLKSKRTESKAEYVNAPIFDLQAIAALVQ